LIGREWRCFRSSFPRPPSLSHIYPIGRFVAGSPEAVFFHKGFQQDGPISVSVFPIIRQTPSQTRQDPGSKISGGDPGKDEKAGVIDYQMEIGLALVVSPTDKPVPRGHLPGRRTPTKGCQQVRSGEDQLP